MTPSDLAPLLENARVVVFLGPGGVGKTTSAAAFAIAAARSGRRVAVLTVDPAARLKDALELPERAGELHRVPLPSDALGTLDAILLDAKGLFDDLVRRLAPGEALAERILANPVYRNVAGTFAGSDAYMALEQVLDVVASAEHDLVVVDTPPASHALELFDAPERILALLQSRALEYLEEPARILGGVGSRLARGLLSAVVAALERFTGLSLLRDISSLASDFHGVAPGFRARAEAIRGLLRDAATRYVLVATPEPHGAREIVEFAGEAWRLGVRCDAVLVNRVLAVEPVPSSRSVGPGRAASRRDGAGGDPPGGRAGGGSTRPWPASLARNLVVCAQDLDTLRQTQTAAIEILRDGLDELDREGSGGPPRLWLEVPALSPAPVTLAAITRLAGSLSAARGPSTSAA